MFTCGKLTYRASGYFITESFWIPNDFYVTSVCVQSTVDFDDRLAKQSSWSRV